MNEGNCLPGSHEAKGGPEWQEAQRMVAWNDACLMPLVFADV